MTDALSARFALPLLQPGQAQKEMTHNEAVATIDLIAQAGVVAAGLATPPLSPAVGQCWIVGASPAGAWSGKSDHLAGWTDGGWRFVAPVEGMAAWVAADGLTARFAGGGWTIGTLRVARIDVGANQVVGARRPAIADPSGGATADAEARAAVAAILSALRGHGLIAA